MDDVSANSDTSRSASAKLMKIEAVAAELDVCTKTVYRLIAEGHLNAVGLGRYLKVARSALQEFIDKGGTLAAVPHGKGSRRCSCSRGSPSTRRGKR